MVNRYETVFIVTPVLSEEQMKETVEKYTNFLKDHGAEIVYTNNWGMRKLAYPIRKLRFLTVSLDKYAVAYNEKKRNAKKAAAETVEEAPATEEEK